MKIEFPSLDFIKSHPRHTKPGEVFFEDYEWYIFDIGEYGYCRIVYNEDDNNKLFLDMMVNGFCDRWVPKGFNKAYPATEKGYEELKTAALKAIDEIVLGIEKSNKEYQEEWE